MLDRADEFGFAIAACLVAAVSSLSRGSRYVAVEPTPTPTRGMITRR